MMTGRKVDGRWRTAVCKCWMSSRLQEPLEGTAANEPLEKGAGNEKRAVLYCLLQEKQKKTTKTSCNEICRLVYSILNP